MKSTFSMLFALIKEAKELMSLAEFETYLHKSGILISSKLINAKKVALVIIT